MSSKHRHTVRYVRASDGVQLAWAQSGKGAPLVKAATWLTHLEYDIESPVWHHWTEFLSDHFSYVRYDERGCGMSDWDVGNLSIDRWVDDLATVVEAAGLTEPFTLLGMSHGAAVCIAYAARYPERVNAMILCGGFVRGALRRSSSTFPPCGGATTRRFARYSRRGSFRVAATNSCDGSTSCAGRPLRRRSPEPCSGRVRIRTFPRCCRW
jgi:pimeloyl-ACP methyl ester carboxylesterase